MTQQEVKSLCESDRLPSSGPVKLVETHANWVLLTPESAYKIKRPVHFSFMDYSTVEKRAHFCRREIELNSRFSDDLYLGVLPVRRHQQKLYIGEGAGEVIDHAVHMRRLDNSRQMSVLMDKEAVKVDHLTAIAHLVADFHQHTEVVSDPIDWKKMYETFADIQDVFPWARENLGTPAVIDKMEEHTRLTEKLLQNLQPRLSERVANGWIVDGHGDLHTGNIFLLEQPVLFDCIEFNDDFRRLDVLDEIAFLCMDLDSYGAEELKQAFIEAYLEAHPCAPHPLDQPLFWYYQAYRANVRFKVTALRAMQAEGTPPAVDFEEMEIYSRLFNAYFDRIRDSEHGRTLLS